MVSFREEGAFQTGEVELLFGFFLGELREGNRGGSDLRDFFEGEEGSLSCGKKKV